MCTYVGYGDAGSSCEARREERQKILHDGEAASKLEMGRHGRGHLVFMARSSLGRKARTRRGGCGLPAVAESDAEMSRRKEKATDRRDQLASVTKRGRRERRGRSSRGPACYDAAY